MYRQRGLEGCGGVVEAPVRQKNDSIKRVKEGIVRIQLDGALAVREFAARRKRYRLPPIVERNAVGGS